MKIRQSIQLRQVDFNWNDPGSEILNQPLQPGRRFGQRPDFIDIRFFQNQLRIFPAQPAVRTGDHRNFFHDTPLFRFIYHYSSSLVWLLLTVYPESPLPFLTFALV